jgi:hypothetical protein
MSLSLILVNMPVDKIQLATFALAEILQQPGEIFYITISRFYSKKCRRI